MSKQITKDYTLRHRLSDCDQFDLQARVENLEVFAVAVATALANIGHYSKETNHGHATTERDEAILLSIMDTMSIMAQGFSAMVARMGITENDHIGVALASLDLKQRTARGEKHDA